MNYYLQIVLNIFCDNKQLILLGNVILQRDDNVLKTNKLIYYVDIIKK